MVVVPAGSFMMGSSERELGRDSDEGPQHKVTIAEPFAVGKYEVTFDEWEACVASGGCDSYKPKDQGWGRGPRPVINVSWNDAIAYVEWLSAKVGKPYRLPSEAEWEYAARAGTTTRYWWGDEITIENANYGRNVGKTTDVGSYPPNRWGLYDMQGNVWEWTEDCYHDSYKVAPEDGSAWMNGDCGSPGAARGLLGQHSEGPPLRLPQPGQHRRPGLLRGRRLPGCQDAYPLESLHLYILGFPKGRSPFGGFREALVIESVH